ncbi:MAG TPA: 6-phosphogluconolactonase [Actinomycetota bacterium]
MSPPHELEVLPSADAVARRGAALFAGAARSAVSTRGAFAAAVSGGRTPWGMFRHLAAEEIPWARVELWQVDERVVPDRDPERTLTRLRASLPEDAAPAVHAMPVDEDDLLAAAGRYAASLPEAFDLVHLGLGDDGHTASLFPGDPVLEVRDRDVALTRGSKRMTLTYPGISRARRLLWLVTGADKASMLPRLLAGDASIPAGRVRGGRSVVLADGAAAGELSGT